MKALASAAFLLRTIGLCILARPLGAQLTLTVSQVSHPTPVVLTPPDSTDYANTVTVFAPVTVTLDCRPTGGGSNACEVDWLNGGNAFQMDYQITGASAGCAAGTNIGTTSVPSTLTKLAQALNKTSTCVFTLNLRAKGISITTFLSGQTYVQALTMTAKRL